VHKVIAKLADWHRLYLQLQDARLRLRQAPSGSVCVRHELEVEVSRLQQESDSQLESFSSGLDSASQQLFSSRQLPFNF
jgi:hypothetical protein